MLVETGKVIPQSDSVQCAQVDTTVQIPDGVGTPHRHEQRRRSIHNGQDIQDTQRDEDAEEKVRLAQGTLCVSQVLFVQSIPTHCLEVDQHHPTGLSQSFESENGAEGDGSKC
mmetsp:Transcript_48272/g.127810  ORF Transcript_48272/g.127810 Transcript_48272/m.127810 type:complete len:113 (+) Transcript_48272:133-471(+)